ncbi:hypothetical protein PybrP1_009456 [[Pythium] brassicae (nom. inval.)]|nr:hypothetical protein PybrP1_009456 [[Pythium] brassicae (nom. inval.)]
MASITSKLRVLCLHGARLNDKVMEVQTQALRHALGSQVEFVFVNGPIEAVGPSEPNVERAFAHTKPFYEWVRIKNAGQELTNEIVDLRSADTEWRFQYVGVDDVAEYIDKQLAHHGPFDVALGFSQGAVTLTYLSLYYLQRSERWWKLCVCVGGVPFRGVGERSMFETPSGEPILVPFPSVHVVGRQDPLCTESLKLAAMYEEHPAGSALPKVVLEHEDGHRFPNPKTNPGFYDKLAGVIRAHFEIESVADSATAGSTAARL